MEFNVQKCAVLSITRKRKPSHYQYSIFGQPFANVDQHDYLGITIASDLRWNSHCNNVFKKSNKTLGLLRRTLAPCSEDVKTKAYESLIRPGLEYASEAWCPPCSEDVKTKAYESLIRPGLEYASEAWCHRLLPRCQLHQSSRKLLFIPSGDASSAWQQSSVILEPVPVYSAPSVDVYIFLSI